MLPEHAEGVYSMTTKNSYLVLNPSGGYDVYIENEYIATVQEIQESFSDLKIYNNLEEVS